MKFSKTQLIFTFFVVLAAFVANFWFLQSKPTSVVPERQRSMMFGKKEIVKNIFLARAQDPLFLEVVEKKMQDGSLQARERLIYAEALAFYNSPKATSLMWRIFQTGGMKEHNRILKGLGEKQGEHNKKLLLKLYKGISELAPLEKIYLYISLYKQSKDEQKKAEAIKFLNGFLDLKQNLGNFLALRFFYDLHLLNPRVVEFSKEVLKSILNNGQFSPVLFSYSIKVLIKKDYSFVVDKHDQFMNMENHIYTRYYIPTLRISCPPGITADLLQRIGSKELSFELFRPIAAELKFFGGDTIKNGFEHLLTSGTLVENKTKYLSELLKKFTAGRQRVCGDKK